MDPRVARILDANLNRAGEAARVIEDYLRFATDDAASAAAAKALRHDLATLRRQIGEPDLLAARDADGDVGAANKTATELSRESAEHVSAASFGRLAEALRCVGEFAKLGAPAAAAAAEALRYRVYALEQRCRLRTPLIERFRAVRLYVLLTAAACARPWLEAAEGALRGGAGCLQLREKTLGDAELLRRARRLRALTQSFGALLIINDRADIARLAGADGVHVGQDDLSVAEVRRIAGGGLLVGKSTHTVEQFDAATAEAPDYIAVGPMFESATKPQAHIAGPATLQAVAARYPAPLVGIGGITPDNARAVFAAGASCVCVCAAVIGSADPQSAAARFARASAAAAAHEV